MEHGHPVGDLEDLRDLVADHDRREAEPAVQVQDQVVDGVDEDRVEPGGGLVEEHDLGLGHQRPAMATRLRMPPEISAGILVAHAGQPHLAQAPPRARRDPLGGSRRLLAEREGHVVRTVMESKRAPPWKTTPYRSRTRSSARPRRP